MANKTPWNIFFKCFQNKATSEELAEINYWLDEDVENIEVLNEVYNIYSISTVLPAPLNPDTSKAWHKVDKKISSKKFLQKSSQYRFRYISIVAALVVFGLMFTSIINNYVRDNQFSRQFTKIVTQPGQKTNVVLPDGSVVWLNSASSLKYQSDFNLSDRQVTLSGEAFFKVQKDQSRRFRVKSGSLNIDVYGTSFNVKNYSDGDFQKVTVAEGIVGISSNSEDIRRITKGDQAILNKASGKITFTKDDPSLVTSWTNNELIFRDTPIDEVMKALESWYGVEIIIDKQMIGGHNYTFKIKIESFKEVLEMMQVMTPFEYKIDGKEVEIKYKN
jgi:transmembrane sensor